MIFTSRAISWALDAKSFRTEWYVGGGRVERSIMLRFMVRSDWGAGGGVIV